MEQFVAVEQVNGHFVAESLAFPELRAEAATEDLAVVKVTIQVREKLRNRKIVRIDLTNGLPDQWPEASDIAVTPRGGLSALFGKYRNDDTLTEICDEAYRLRDADTPASTSHDSV